MCNTQPEPPLIMRIMTVVRARGPLTFPQIVHAAQGNRGSIWRLLKQLQDRGQIQTVTLHGRTHYIAGSG